MKILAWIIGLIAFVFYVLSIQKEKKSGLLIYQLIANILYSIQYLLLGVPLAALMNIISVLRIASFYKYDKDKQKAPLYTLIIFLSLIFIVGVLSIDYKANLLNILITLIPIVITILYTISTWKNNMNSIRIVFMICAVLWMIYNFKVLAYTSLLGNFFELPSGIIAYFRYKKKSKN